MLNLLFEIHMNVVNGGIPEKKRYLYEKIPWETRGLCVLGGRGVGKTTLLLQFYREKYNSPEQCLYISADNIHVSSLGLFNIASDYFKYGGKCLILDEVHKYPDWSIEVKNILDTFRDRQVIISGSSALDLSKSKGDLSRRMVYMELKGMSFREYLNFRHQMSCSVLTLEDILAHHTRHAAEISSHAMVLKYFNEYLTFGYYPFFLEGTHTTLHRIENIVEKVLFEDIAVLFRLTQQTLPVMRKILWLISTSHPFVPNVEKMSRELHVSKSTIYNYLEYLTLSGLLLGFRKNDRGFKLVRKPGKIYLENTSLLAAMTGSLNIEANTGNVRETFFANQLNQSHGVHLHHSGDFLIDNKWVFEIGGKNKTFCQVKDENDAYLALDRIEIGVGNKIPLWLFGFLY